MLSRICPLSCLLGAVAVFSSEKESVGVRFPANIDYICENNP